MRHWPAVPLTTSTIIFASSRWFVRAVPPRWRLHHGAELEGLLLRPPLDEAAKVVESVRLEPDLRAEAEERTAAEGVSTSELIRCALREYLRSA